jgi:hypothetical protein
MVCSWCSRYTAAAVLLSQEALESSGLQKYIKCRPAICTEAVSPSRNKRFHRHNDNHKTTGTQEITRPLLWFPSYQLLQLVNRSLMTNFGVIRSDTLHGRQYNHYCHLHNLTSRSFSLVVDSDTTSGRTNTLTHLNRYHHQFPLDLQGWPRRWTQTVLSPHISVVIKRLQQII